MGDNIKNLSTTIIKTVGALVLVLGMSVGVSSCDRDDSPTSPEVPSLAVRGGGGGGTEATRDTTGDGGGSGGGGGTCVPTRSNPCDGGSGDGGGGDDGGGGGTADGNWVTDGQTWSGTLTQDGLCVSGPLYQQCSLTGATDVLVHDFVIDLAGSGDVLELGNDGAINVQGDPESKAKGVVIENGAILSCKPEADPNNPDKEHHAGLLIKNATQSSYGPGVTVRNVEITGCLSAFYFKYAGDHVLIEDSWIHADRGGIVRVDNLTFNNNRFGPGNGPIFQEIATFNDPVDNIDFRLNSVIGGVDVNGGSGHVFENNVFVGDAGIDPAAYPNNCFLPNADPNEVFADYQNGDFTLIGDYATTCAGHGVQ